MYSYILIGVGKVWDWDGLDSEFLSNGNSNGGNAAGAGGELMEDGGVGGSNQTYHQIYFSSNSFLLLLHSYF